MLFFMTINEKCDNAIIEISKGNKLVSVLGAAKNHLSSAKHKVFAIVIVLFSKSTFHHRKAKHSPILDPVNKRN